MVFVVGIRLLHPSTHRLDASGLHMYFVSLTCACCNDKGRLNLAHVARFSVYFEETLAYVLICYHMCLHVSGFLEGFLDVVSMVSLSSLCGLQIDYILKDEDSSGVTIAFFVQDIQHRSELISSGPNPRR